MSVYPVKEFFQNKVVFSEGTEGDVAYILKKGCVGISVKAGDKKNELARLRPPAVFGEMALILKEHKRTATATALEHCEVVEISRQAFNDYVGRSPSVISSVLKALADRLLTTTMKALRTPDLFMGACEILHLFGKNGKGDLPYDETVRSLTKAFFVDSKQIEGFIEMMLNANLIESKDGHGGVKIICIPQNDDFLQRADKIYNGLKNMA